MIFKIFCFFYVFITIKQIIYLTLFSKLLFANILNNLQQKQKKFSQFCSFFLQNTTIANCLQLAFDINPKIFAL